MKFLGKTLLALCLSCLASEAFAEDQTVWQLGSPEAKANGFSIVNNQWEYGRFPNLTKTPGFNPETNVFTYEVKGAGAAKAVIPQYICSPYYRFWMPPEECVSGLKLVWNEESDGFRKIEFNVIESKDVNGLPDDFRAALPDGQVVYFQVPTVDQRMPPSKARMTWSASFAVKKGVNSLQLDDVMNSRQNLARFNSIKLLKIDSAASCKPVIESKMAKLGNIFHPGETPEIEVSLYNAIPNGAKLKCEVFNWQGKLESTKELQAVKGVAKIQLPTNSKGWFRVNFALKDSAGKIIELGSSSNFNEISYAVLEQPVEGFQPKSFFGCVPTEFGWHDFYWKEGTEDLFKLTKIAGFGYMRIHSFDYAQIQPKRDGKPDWSLYDSAVEMAERNKLCMTASITGTPKWASKDPSVVSRLGIKELGYVHTTPDFTAWTEWCGKMAERYKMIKYWEIWNEAGYRSGYWLSGSAEDYAKLLATSHKAIKEANPEALTFTSFGGPDYRFCDDVLKHLDGKRAFDLLGFHYCKPSDAPQWHATLGPTFDAPLIDTEESLSDKDDLLQTERVLKAAAYPANGIVKTIFYAAVKSDLDGNWSLLRSTGSPRPGFAAMRTLTHRLENAEFVGELPLGVECKAYLFSKGGTPVLFAWSERKDMEERIVEKSIDIGAKEVKLVDPMDNETVLATKNGVATLTLSSMPLILEGGDLKELKRLCALNVSANPLEPVLLAGSKDTLELNLSNRSSEELEAKIEITNKSALKLNFSSKSLKLKAGESVSLPLEIEAPATLGRATCPMEIKVSYAIGGKVSSITTLLTVNTTLVPPGENLLGSFDKTHWNLMQGSSWTPEGYIKSENSKGKGGAGMFGSKDKIPVLPGDKYALVAKARRGNGGSEVWGGVQRSYFDGGDKMVFPAKPGCNTLTVVPTEKWGKYGDVFSIDDPKAKSLSLFFLSCYDKEGEIDWNDIKLVQLTGKVGLNKAMWQGDCRKVSTAPKIDADLSDWKEVEPLVIDGENPASPKAYCYARWDNSNLYLAFKVRDEKFYQPNSGFEVFNGDCIEFAIDPTMDGKDRNEYSMALTPLGVQLFRRNCFVTPEILTTMYFGIVKEAEAAAKYENGFMLYELRLPLSSIFPLKLGEGERFGFSWVADDNNGDGRKFQEWSEGIAREKAPAKYGMLRCLPASK